jgi:hypothetical protein
MNNADSKTQAQTDKEAMLLVIKAVAHIGVDFGYGEYEIEQEYIDIARDICEQEDIIYLS